MAIHWPWKLNPSEMAPDDRNNAVFSHSLTEETTAMKRQRLTNSTGTLTSPSRSLPFSSSDTPLPVPSLPLDLVEEILYRLPVKLLLQLRCLCKSWNSLISDTKFAKKHLRVATTRRLHVLGLPEPSRRFFLSSYPLHSVFTTNATQQLEFPLNNSLNFIVGSCDGILCIANDTDRRPALLWNPSIGKFKELPPFENPPEARSNTHTIYGFGHDSFTDNYKVIAVFYSSSYKTEVKVHSLGTNFWRRIQDFPSAFGVPFEESGKFVSGTVNWLAYKMNSCVIVSLDLGKESYQEVLQPDYGGVVDVLNLNLGVLRDCLCTLFSHDVWVMKEYGNKESWTKLFTVPYMGDPNTYGFTKVVYMSEDDQVVLEFIDEKLKLAVYDSRNGTLKIHEMQNTPEVTVESLISPCS